MSTQIRMSMAMLIECPRTGVIEVARAVSGAAWGGVQRRGDAGGAAAAG